MTQQEMPRFLKVFRKKTGRKRDAGGCHAFAAIQRESPFRKSRWAAKACKQTEPRRIAASKTVPVRRGLVDHPTDWPWSSARFYAEEKDVPLVMDPLVEF